MYWRYWGTNLWLNIGWELAHWRRRPAPFWYGGDKTPRLVLPLPLFTLGPPEQGERPAPGRRLPPADPPLPRAQLLFRGARGADRRPVRRRRGHHEPQGLTPLPDHGVRSGVPEERGP